MMSNICISARVSDRENGGKLSSYREGTRRLLTSSVADNACCIICGPTDGFMFAVLLFSRRLVSCVISGRVREAVNAGGGGPADEEADSAGGGCC